MASRRFGQNAAAESRKPAPKRDQTKEEPGSRSVGDELQTAETFDHDIIGRMGAWFYDAVFVPAITAARAGRD